MRIKNLPSKETYHGIFIIFAMFLGFIILNILFLFTHFTSGKSFSSLISSFAEMHFEMQLVSIATIILPFAFLFYFVKAFRSRVAADRLAKKKIGFIEYVDFENYGMRLSYLNSNQVKNVYYKDIDSMELVIETGIAYNKYGSYSVVSGLHINIKFGSEIFSIYCTPVDLAKMYKIIYYSQFMKNFSYRIIGDGDDAKRNLRVAIENYIKNNYKDTIVTKLSSSVNPIILLVIFLSILVGLLAFVQSLFRY